MNNPASPSDDSMPPASREDMLAALFANMVIQQTNMAMMLLGKAPHPQTGEMMQDLESAKMFIDQLEMIEVKTKGNLSKREEDLLKQALAAVHMTFVEVVDGAGQPAEAAAAAPAPATSPAPTAATPPAATEPSAAADESRKKFSKKY